MLQGPPRRQSGGKGLPFLQEQTWGRTNREVCDNKHSGVTRHGLKTWWGSENRCPHWLCNRKSCFKGSRRLHNRPFPPLCCLSPGRSGFCAARGGFFFFLGSAEVLCRSIVFGENVLVWARAHFQTEPKHSLLWASSQQLKQHVTADIEVSNYQERHQCLRTAMSAIKCPSVSFKEFQTREHTHTHTQPCRTAVWHSPRSNGRQTGWWMGWGLVGKFVINKKESWNQNHSSAETRHFLKPSTWFHDRGHTHTHTETHTLTSCPCTPSLQTPSPPQNITWHSLLSGESVWCSSDVLLLLCSHLVWWRQTEGGQTHTLWQQGWCSTVSCLLVSFKAPSPESDSVCLNSPALPGSDWQSPGWNVENLIWQPLCPTCLLRCITHGVIQVGCSGSCSVKLEQRVMPVNLYQVKLTHHKQFSQTVTCSECAIPGGSTRLAGECDSLALE